jgi:hypothetical protein
MLRNTRMTKKTSTGKRTGRSSISQKRVSSATLPETLDLGRLITQQLGENRPDVLSRWMAHHVAELIGDAEKQPDSPAGRAIRAKLAEAILQLWEHRLSVESHLNPFGDLKSVAHTLRTLNRNENGWLSFNAGAISRVYDAFRRLVLCIAFKRMETLAEARKAVSRAQLTRKFQTAEEKLIANTLDIWLDDASKKRLSVSARNSKSPLKSKTTKAPPSDLAVIAESILGELREALDKLADELARSRGQRKGASQTPPKTRQVSS